MDFRLDDDDLAIQEGMRSLCAGRFPIEEIREGELTPRVLVRWSELAEMGLFTVGTPDGLTRRQGALAFEELGRALVPGPIVDSAIVGAVAPEAMGGDLVVVRAWESEPVTVVEFPAELGALLLIDADQVRLAVAPELDLDLVERPLDALTPIGIARGPLPRGEVVGDAAVAAVMRRDGMLLTAAQQAGLALGATALATEYAKGREQFGKPIGAFQAVKHLLAEMLVKAEVAKVAVHAAACALDGVSDQDPDEAVNMAKFLAGEAALFCGKTGIQVHGGMGFTWEVDAQRYWKRAAVLETRYSSSTECAMELSSAL